MRLYDFVIGWHTSGCNIRFWVQPHWSATIHMLNHIKVLQSNGVQSLFQMLHFYVMEVKTKSWTNDQSYLVAPYNSAICRIENESVKKTVQRLRWNIQMPMQKTVTIRGLRGLSTRMAVLGQRRTKYFVRVHLLKRRIPKGRGSNHRGGSKFIKSGLKRMPDEDGKVASLDPWCRPLSKLHRKRIDFKQCHLMVLKILFQKTNLNEEFLYFL